jgi:hypothetical protein
MTTGTRMPSSSKPHGLMNTRSSSNQPQMPVEMAALSDPAR